MLVLAPSSRAQAEVAPDHYDAVEALSAKPKAHVKQASANLTQEQRKGELFLTPAPAANSQRRELVAVQDKRKPASSNTIPR